YTYDAAHRLVAARHPDGKRQVFLHDRAGNLVQQPGLTGVVLSEGNRLAWANGDRFEYNDRNDVAVREGEDGTTRYHYDSRDNLVRCDMRDGTWRACYDPLVRRIRKSYHNQEFQYYWDTDRLAAESIRSGRLRIYVYADAFALQPILFLEYDGIDADPGSC